MGRLYKKKDHINSYNSWMNMKYRCDNPKAQHYDYYGGRGISYQKDWVDFDKFYEDMGERLDDETLDREDSEGHYTKANCRWATRKMQASNTKARRTATLLGITKSLQEWCTFLDINRNTLVKRLNSGWSDDNALLKPISERHRLNSMKRLIAEEERSND